MGGHAVEAALRWRLFLCLAAAIDEMRFGDLTKI
jgi:hypothetical protein